MTAARLPALGPLDHVALAVHDLDAALAFYREALGLEPLPAPPEAVAAGIRWLDLGGGRALHLIELPGARGPARAHVALAVDDCGAWRAHLEALGADLREPQVALYAAERLFVADPSGNLIELVAWLDGGGA